MFLFDPSVTSFIKLLIYISVLHTRCYPSDDVAPSVFMIVTHVTLLTLLLILPNQVDYRLSFQVTSVVKMWVNEGRFD